MQKYRLINFKTKEERLCDKVTIDGYNYYISVELGINRNDFYYDFHNNIRQWTHEFQKDNKLSNSIAHTHPKVIATNNPNIDIPKVVDEVEIEEFAWKEAKSKFTKEENREPNINNDKDCFIVGLLQEGIIHGYNKSQESYPFSLDDVKEIINLAREQYWDVDNRGFSSNTEGDWSFKYSTEDEIIQKYQETKVLTIFYE